MTWLIAVDQLTTYLAQQSFKHHISSFSHVDPPFKLWAASPSSLQQHLLEHL
ncbi:hypothetical protein XYCOK13_02350 [Xylanibacillus composti]|uniref:Uncharacterized protein n=1 Tax=Xylanibacillus composti TaxID=1572762 RepID=A0A8J4H0M5_9BACL|nr:hypothetical protein XYCOK13_02350 [Xylanibacillus composti]